MARVEVSGMACIGCALIIANDDDSSVSDPSAHRDAMARNSVTSAGEVLAWVVLSDQRDPYATTPCIVCGTSLAGERHAVAGLVS